MFPNRTRGSRWWLSAGKALVLVLCFVDLSYGATLISCSDGDTCRFKEGTKTIKVRLDGVDAPEIDQPFGIESRDFLIQFLKGKDVTLKCGGLTYDRVACKVFVGQQDVLEHLVRNGLAWDFPKYSSRVYQSAQKEAQRRKVGLWSKPLAVSPHCWRWTGTKDCNDSTYMP